MYRGRVAALRDWVFEGTFSKAGTLWERHPVQGLFFGAMVLVPLVLLADALGAPKD